MTTEHTPTPWRFEQNNYGIYDSDEGLIANVDDSDFCMNTEEANAAFIVTAVNAYAADQALIADLADALRSFTGYAVSSIGMDRDGYVIKLVSDRAHQPTFADFERARAVLARVPK